MNKYKVGDKVKVKSLKELEEIGHIEGPIISHGADESFVGCMNKFCGEVVTIAKIKGVDSYYIAEDSEGWCFDDWMLEPVEEVGCFNCKHFNPDDDGDAIEKCYNCKLSYLKDSKEYQELSNKWEAANTLENINLDTPVMVFNDTYEPDMVNHPKHYTECSLECIQVMELMFGRYEVARWCIITAFKYLWRYKSKNGDEDLDKAKWYLDKAQELAKSETRGVELMMMIGRMEYLLSEIK